MLSKIKKERTLKVKKEKKSDAITSSKTESNEVDVVTETVVPEAEEKPAEKSVSATKVGTLLKNMRLEKGLKVVDIAKRLCIRKQYLEAIEDNNYSEIPAFPYGVGFIRSYANFLGLNSENIVELYKEETSTKKVPVITISEVPSNSGMPGLVYVIISLAALAIVYGAWKMLNNSAEDPDDVYVAEDSMDNSADMIVVEETVLENDTTSESAQPTEPVVEASESQLNDKPVAVDNKTTSDKVETPTTDVQPQEEKNNEEKREAIKIPEKGVFIEVLEETWVEVKTELKLYLSKVLKEGDTYTLPDDKGLILSVGKLGGVNVYVNGIKTELTHSGRKMNIDIDAYIKANH